MTFHFMLGDDPDVMIKGMDLLFSKDNLDDDKPSTMRHLRQALNILEQMDDAVIANYWTRVVVPWAADPRAEVRRAILEFVGKLVTSKPEFVQCAIPVLSSRFDDPDPAVLREAADVAQKLLQATFRWVSVSPNDFTSNMERTLRAIREVREEAAAKERHRSVRRPDHQQ